MTQYLVSTIINALAVFSGIVAAAFVAEFFKKWRK